jgi:phage gp36-like protein
MSYATLADLSTYGAQSATFGSLSDAQKLAALAAASSEADGYLRSRYPRTALPLTQYDTALTIAVVKISTFELLRLRGFNPNAGSDAVIVKAADDARAWLKSLARGEVSIVGAPDPATPAEQPRVISGALRGW